MDNFHLELRPFEGKILSSRAKDKNLKLYSVGIEFPN